MNTAQAIEAFCDFQRYVRGVGASSAALYRWHLKAFVRWTTASFARDPGAILAVDELAPRVEHYLVALGRRELSEAHRAKAHTVIRAFYLWAFERGYAKLCPLRWTKAPRIRRKPQVYLDPAEIERLLRAAATSGGMHAERDAAILATFYFAGGRLMEILTARAAGLDLDGGLLEVIGKGGDVQFLIVPPRLREILAAWLRVRPSSSPLLFPSQALHRTRTGQIDAARIEKQLREVYAPRAGLTQRVTPHALRRSAIENLKAPDRIVQAFARHADYRTTQRFYRRPPAADEIRSWAKKLYGEGPAKGQHVHDTPGL